MELRLPAPSLLVLVGPSSSGKTSWAGANFRDEKIVSSDRLRAMVGAGEDDRRAGTAAFEILERVVAERLARGLTTVVDTLGFDRERRLEWVRQAHDAKLPAVAVVFEIPAEECERRNKARARPLPRSVLRRQLSRMQAVQEELPEDGFDMVIQEQPVVMVAPEVARAAATIQPNGGTVTGHTFGLTVSRFDWDSGPEAMADHLGGIARRAEAAGFRDLWVMDHFRQIPSIGRPWEDLPESYTTLAYLAGITSRIRLGALVTGVTYRNPALLGKMIATLDVLSGGRANCGLGLGWNAEEHAGYGWELPTVAERYRLLEDTLEMLPLLWGKGSPAYAGRVFSASELMCYPRPIQEKIPITIGGSGERRTLRLVARHGDACNLFGKPDRVAHKVSVLRDHCVTEGRDPREVEVTHLITAMAAADRAEVAARVEMARTRDQTVEEFSARSNAGTVDDLSHLVAAYQDAGATHTIVSIPDVSLPGSIEAFTPLITRFGEP
jgi:F420-dependent oxidoreductase-like protein